MVWRYSRGQANNLYIPRSPRVAQSAVCSPPNESGQASASKSAHHPVLGDMRSYLAVGSCALAGLLFPRWRCAFILLRIRLLLASGGEDGQKKGGVMQMDEKQLCNDYRRSGKVYIAAQLSGIPNYKAVRILNRHGYRMTCEPKKKKPLSDWHHKAANENYTH